MTTVTRIKFENGMVRSFDGRSLVHELDISNYTNKQHDACMNRFEILMEKTVQEHADKGWRFENKQWRSGGAHLTVKDIEKAFDLTTLVGAKEPVLKKGDKVKIGKSKEVLEVTEIVTDRMRVTAEQRVRKTPVTEMELALDDFILEHGRDNTLRVKGRRMINQKNFDRVVKENGLVVKGNNNGQRKMNLRNMLVARYNRGEEVTIGGTSFKLPTPKKTKKVA